MKKIINLFATLLVAFILMSCTTLPVSEVNSYYFSFFDTNNEWYEQHREEEPENPSINYWDTDHRIDEFGSPTDKPYIYTTTEGTFSNSATINSKLFVKVIANKNNVELLLLEYGKYPIDEDAYAKIKCGDSVYNIGKCHFNERTKRLVIQGEDGLDAFTLMSMLKYDDVNVYIESGEYSLSTYRFTIKSSGFEFQYYNTFIYTLEERLEDHKKLQEDHKKLLEDTDIEKDAINFAKTQMATLWPQIEAYKAERAEFEDSEDYKLNGWDSTWKNQNASDYWDKKNEEINRLLQNAGYGSVRGSSIKTLNRTTVENRIKTNYIEVFNF